MPEYKIGIVDDNTGFCGTCGELLTPSTRYLRAPAQEIICEPCARAMIDNKSAWPSIESQEERAEYMADAQAMADALGIEFSEETWSL